MERLEFRLLRADEIDVRVSQITTKNVMLLLYKDARCDMNILDETVGPLNWKREHTRDNANCIVSVWDSEKSQWIGKEDTGTESFTEAEKGLASDSFKRACVNFGIGRELYTAPSLFFPIEKTRANKDTQGKYKCYDKFIVTDIEYDGRQITFVRIKDVNTGEVLNAGRKRQGNMTQVYHEVATPVQRPPLATENRPVSAPTGELDKSNVLIGEEQKTAFLDKIKARFTDKDECNGVYKQIMGEFGITGMAQMTYGMWIKAVVRVDEIADQRKSA